MQEKIRILMLKRNIQLKELAEKLGTSSGNLSNKLKRNNFSQNELEEIAIALNCKFNASFTMNDTGETI